jgi:predicted transposase/invertase (TIGR01784 family)
LANITQDEVEYARMSNLIKSQLDYQSGMVSARREGLREGFTKGHDEGLSEGRNEANLENAQKMKAMGFLTEQIQAVTGLSIETITQL